MQQYPEYTRERLKQLGRKMQDLVYRERRPVDELLVSGCVDRIPLKEAEALPYRPAKLGEQFGPLWATFWFKGTAKIPQQWDGRRVDLLWISHSEATLWLDGQTAQGLNYEPAAWAKAVRPDAILRPRAKGGETVPFRIEMACNRLFGDNPPFFKQVSNYVLDQCDIAAFDPLAWEMWHDFLILQQLECEGTNDLDKDWAGKLLCELNRFANAFDPEDQSTWADAHWILKSLYQNRNGSYKHELSAIGHAHIDTAWLWPLAETYRKCERTFSSAAAYMEEYQEYKFCCSQAQQYAWIKERNPQLYARIAAKVKAGQWVPVGGTWVEPDCNIPSGESLARQFLYGQRFFRQEFGVTCKEFWNPDVFGYNGQLPQIMAQSGATRFLTQKLSWNRFNRPRHQTFTWQGVDGSEVLTHFPPANTYNATATVAELRKNVRDYKDNDRSGHSMMLFGFGDGGGGPTKTMIESLRRARDLQGLPRTQMRSSDEFFMQLEKDCTDRPVMVGELYLEYHRGTYTTQAANKRDNRRCEELLHDIEAAAALAGRLGKGSYPGRELEDLWKIVLLNQFHDIIPGSSITLVYEDSARQYANVLARGGRLREEAMKALGAGTTLRPFNSTSFGRREVAERPDGSLAFIEADSYGWGRESAAGDSVKVAEAGDHVTLENAHLRAKLDRGGRLVSLVEKSSGREVMAAGAAGDLLIYDDVPTEYDAWDVDPFHMETEKPCPPAEGWEIVRTDALRGEVAFERKIGKQSTLRMIVRLDAASRRLEFRCSANWHETNKMLKAAFPVNVRSMNATYEMQFGAVERPTHFNTTYDLARYEVPGHRWSDLSEHGFGVTLLSESKYGFSTFGNIMRISLLRSPKMPDPQADMGHHEFAFALMPHQSGWREAGAVAEGYAFNMPTRWVPAATPAPASSAPASYASVDTPNLVLATIKNAEDSDDLVLRLYECHGARGSARVKLGVPFRSARLCNILEEDGEALTVHGDTIEVPYRPWQIISIKVT